MNNNFDELILKRRARGRARTSSMGVHGGYGEIRKVCISRVANIPTIVDFAGKMSKAVKEVDKRVERAKEAMACPIEHPGLIKFWAINSVTMEAYTLWWNGKSVRSF
jgi:serine/threonine protein kinase